MMHYQPKDTEVTKPDGSRITVPNVPTFTCDKCGDEAIPHAGWDQISDALDP